MKRSWKRVAAGALSLAMVAGMMPANVGTGGLFTKTAITASAEDEYIEISTSDDLQNAIKSSGNYRLADDITVGYLYIEHDFVLDLAGKTLTITDDGLVVYGGNVTIEDSEGGGKLVGNININSGTLTIKGGSFKNFNPTDYLADGYTAKQDDDGYWTVSAKSGNTDDDGDETTDTEQEGEILFSENFDKANAYYSNIGINSTEDMTVGEVYNISGDYANVNLSDITLYLDGSLSACTDSEITLPIELTNMSLNYDNDRGVMQLNESPYYSFTLPSTGGCFTLKKDSEGVVTLAYDATVKTYEDYLPDGWTIENGSENTIETENTWYVSTKGASYWIGNYSAHSGTKYICHNGTNSYSEYLVTPKMDLLGAEDTMALSFWYQNLRDDELKVYYRVDGGTWQELFATDGEHEDWTKEIKELPEDALAANVQFGFYANTNNGSGCRIDDVKVGDIKAVSAAEPVTYTEITESYELSNLGENGGYYKLAGNFEPYSLNVYQNDVTLDLAGNKLTIGENGLSVGDATLTIEDSVGGGELSVSTINFELEGKLIITGGVFSVSEINDSDGTLTITGGKFENGELKAYVDESKYDITETDGYYVVSAKSGNTGDDDETSYTEIGDSTAFMNACEWGGNYKLANDITDDEAFEVFNDIVLDLAGNTLKLYSLRINGKKVTIEDSDEGGTFSVESYEDLCEYLGDGTLTITGGKFNFNPTQYLAEGYTAKQDDDGYWVVSEKTESAVTYTKVEAVEPTCTEKGNSEYYKGSDGKYYTLENDTYTEIEENSWVLNAKGHSYGEPTWTWSEDYSSASAAFACENDDDTQNVTATISSETTDPTCTADGKTVYTAKVTFNGTEYTDTKTVVISATGHSYGKPEWTWTGDEENGYTASAKFTCTSGDDEQTKTATVTSDTTAAKCTVDGKTVYSASVEFEGETYTDEKTVVISATGHTPGDAIKLNESEPSYTDVGSYDEVVNCTVCGDEISKQTVIIPKLTLTYVEKIDATCEEDGHIEYWAGSDGKYFSDAEAKNEITLADTVISAKGHDWDEPTYTWSEDYSQVTATRVCKNDASHVETETVDTNYAIETAATCEEKGTGVYTATFENEAFTQQTKNVDIDALGHTYGEPTWTWTKNGDGYAAAIRLVCTVGGDEKSVPAKIDTAESNSTITYTATVTYEGKDYTNVKTVQSAYTLDVEGGEISSGAKNSYSYGDAVTVKAAESRDGKYFSGWYIGETQVSNALEYTLFVTENMTVTAKYEGESVITEQPFVSFMISERTDVGNSKESVTLTVQWTVPSGYEFVGAGLVRRYGSDEDLDLEHVDGSTIRCNCTNLTTANGTYKYTFTMSAETKLKAINGKGYVTYKDSEGIEHTIYTNLVVSEPTGTE